MIRTGIGLLVLLLGSAAAPADEPLRLHPDNPHYFLFRGRPTVLVTSGEHYGAVLNRDFDYARYLDVLKAHGFNLTRTFSGTYRGARVTVRVLAEAGKAYAVYVNGGTGAELVLDLPAGDYRAEWVGTRTGKVEKAEDVAHPGGGRSLTSPAYSEDVALRVKKVSARR